MTLFQRQVSVALTLVMLFTSVMSTVLVVCKSGSDHHAIEAIGHQTGLLEHSVDTLASSEPISEHHAHPDSCSDTSLLADLLIQRDKKLAGWEDSASSVILVYTINDLVAPVVTLNSQRWSFSLNATWLRPATDDLSTIRLLI